MELIPTNDYQTKITEALLETLDKDVAAQLMEVVTEIPLVRNLISPNRERAKDRPRDERGRIIVDLTNPHILEDMDYFREVAIRYNETGNLTDLKPSNDPGSPYVKWLRRELDRIWNGMVRPSDGEWITGYMYWYMNYCPIMLSRIKEGTKRADRIEAMPETWEGVYWRFHYMDQAAALGKHCAELASRSKSKSYTLASILSHLFLVGDNQEARNGVTGIVTASSKEYLVKDGILSKFVRMIDFCSAKTQFPKRRLKNSIQDMTWKSGYKEVGTDAERGSLNTIIGVTSNDDESKIRGKRAAKILIEEMGCHLIGTKVLLYNGSIKNVEDITTNDVLMGNDGTPRQILEIHSGCDEMYKITLANGDYHIVNRNHLLYYKKCNWLPGGVCRTTEVVQPVEEFTKIPNTGKGYYIPKAIIKFPKRPVTVDPYFLGLWLGDGFSDRLIIGNGDHEILTWLSERYNGYIRDLKNTNACKVFCMRKGENKEYDMAFKELNLYKNKHIPEVYKINCPDVQLAVIAGLVDADGSLNSKKTIFEISQRWDRKHILEDIKFMCECNGLKCHISQRIAGPDSKKPGVLQYRLRISGDLSIIPTKVERKQGRLHQGYRTRNSWQDYTFRVEPFGIGEYYGFTTDGNHLFCLSDLTVTHNSFARLLNLYNVLLPSVQEGDIAFGQIVMVGTSGDSESDFSGAREILCNPEGYNMYALKNIYDREGKGRSKFTFFFPGYINRKGCYNHDGVSDVVKALIEILVNRYNVRKGSTDTASIMRTISEVPITPDEAMMRNEGNMFPVADCVARIAQLDSDPNTFDGVYVGELRFNTRGDVEFCPTTEPPIRDYPLKDNRHVGALEIYEMPQRDDKKKVYTGRYCAGLDPYGTDEGVSDSLGSIFVLDLWTDRLVAEYTGRTMYVDDFNEACRKLCLFYNARLNYENNLKGVFSYFTAHNSTYLLTETLEFLKDKQMAKPGVGNSARGTTATQAVNSYARNLLRSWLVAPVTIQNPDGTESTIARLFTLKNRALLRELVSYNSTGNFDRISAMGMLMLLREEKIILYQGDVRGGQEHRRAGYLGDDPFFTKNYGGGNGLAW